jgi:hypothetical protein
VLDAGDAQRRTEPRLRRRPAIVMPDPQLDNEEAEQLARVAGEPRSSDWPGRMTRIDSGSIGKGGSGGTSIVSPRVSIGSGA